MIDPTDLGGKAAARLVSGKPVSLQVAALCWRRSRKKGLRILLITSRDTGRWVIPKGWPMRQRTPSEAAEREAWEEAGVQGKVYGQSIGEYTYAKYLGPGKSIPCLVKVYPLKVKALLKQYPETGQRKARWFSPKKAAKRVHEDDLARMLRGFDPDDLD
jgi:8-oxo-dGTP pyrophosphatase MutT (NUDIX family)